jgi:hypothetical protein
MTIELQYYTLFFLYQILETKRCKLIRQTNNIYNNI